MAENKEIKPKSFRLDDDTAERFRDIAAEIGGNQQETLSKLIEAYEFQKGKAILIERKADIERFEGYVNLLSRMFMSVLEDNQNVSETVRGEFVAQLNAKDMTIRDLQDKVNSIVSNHETVAAELEKIKEAHAATDELLKKSRSDLKEKETQLTSMLADKDVLNKALSGTIEEQKEKIARMGEELSSAQDIKEKFKGMISSLEEAEKSHMAATQEIGVSIVDENTLQGTFNRNPEIYSFTKVNEALITASMGSSIFSDNGYKAVEVAVNYLKLQDSGLERIGYQGAQGTVYNEFYIFDTTFGGTTIFWYYVNTKDLRLFTETEYYNIVNP